MLISNLARKNIYSEGCVDHEYLYCLILEEECESFVKIGISKSPRSRLKQLQTATHRPLNLFSLRCFEGSPGVARVIENYCHKYLKPHKSSGEWFFINSENVEFIESISFNFGFNGLVKNGEELEANYSLLRRFYGN